MDSYVSPLSWNVDVPDLFQYVDVLVYTLFEATS